MSIFSELLMVLGAAVAVIAGLGVVRFRTSFARFHAAGKASPVAFIIAGLGAAIELGWVGAGYILIAAVAMILTLPVGVHLLFRAVHRTSDNRHLVVDDLGAAEIERNIRAEPEPE